MLTAPRTIPAARLGLLLLLLLLLPAGCSRPAPQQAAGVSRTASSARPAAGGAGPAAGGAGPTSSSGSRPPAPIVLLNETDQPVPYTLGEAPDYGAQKTLAPGARERWAGRSTLRLSFVPSGAATARLLLPGEQYSFRRGPDGQLDLHRKTPSLMDLGPFVPTPMMVVHKMLELAEVKATDKIYDLGCGDGRIVIAAAERHGARGVGIDLDPALIAQARAAAAAAGTAQLVELRIGDATQADISDATVVALFLLPEGNEIVRKLLESQLRPGSRVVTHRFELEGWQERLIAETAVLAEDGLTHPVYVYRK